MKFEKISKEQYNIDVKNACINCAEYEELKLPKRTTAFSAGYDFYSPMDFILAPDESIKLPTGIKAQLDEDKFLMIAPRSGQGFKYKLQLFNTIGVVDKDYYDNENNEGHIWIKLYNDSPDNAVLIIDKGDAICQGIITQYFKVEDDESDAIRNGGFGSTTR